MRSRIRARTVTAALLTVLVASFIGPAVVIGSHMALDAEPTGGARRPDGWVQYRGGYDNGGDLLPNPGPVKGKDIYNRTANHQVATVHESGDLIGWVDSFKVTIQNDGRSSDRFKVKATGGSLVTYYKGSTNITAAVKAGTYRTARLAAGAKTSIEVRIEYEYESAVTLVTIKSVADRSKVDAVKARLIVP